MVAEIDPFVWYHVATIFHNNAKSWHFQISIFLHHFHQNKWNFATKQYFLQYGVMEDGRDMVPNRGAYLGNHCIASSKILQNLVWDM